MINILVIEQTSNYIKVKFNDKDENHTPTLYKPKVGCSKMGVLFYYVSLLNDIKNYHLNDIKKHINNRTSYGHKEYTDVMGLV